MPTPIALGDYTSTANLPACSTFSSTAIGVARSEMLFHVLLGMMPCAAVPPDKRNITLPPSTCQQARASLYSCWTHVTMLEKALVPTASDGIRSISSRVSYRTTWSLNTFNTSSQKYECFAAP